MEYIIKKFDELSVDELFDIYKLRVSVFVVEQNCPYQEVDDADKKAYHVILKDKGQMMAYCRVLPAGATLDDVSIGRVIAVKRRAGYGTLVVSKGLNVAINKFHARKVSLEAQTYAKRLYEKIGFVKTSQEYMEDGIPHIQMTWRADDKKRS